MRHFLGQHDYHPYGQGERHDPRQDGQIFVRCREDPFHGRPCAVYAKSIYSGYVIYTKFMRLATLSHCDILAVCKADLAAKATRKLVYIVRCIVKFP
jgi:hypothetical protein